MKNLEYSPGFIFAHNQPPLFIQRGLTSVMIALNADSHGEVGILQNRGADFLSKVLQVPAVTHAGEIAKRLIDGVNFDSGAHDFQSGHHPVRHIRVQLIVAGERGHVIAPE